MPPRQARSQPTVFLMTDERMGERLWNALERLPRGAGVVFRHYGLPPVERRHLFEAVRGLCRRRGLCLILAGPVRQAIAWKADGVHGRDPHRISSRPLLRTAPAHDRPELVAACRRGCDLIFVSPVFRTRSHPGGAALGRVRLGLMTTGKTGRTAALGGMSSHRAQTLRTMGIRRWAAIDAWSRD